MNGVCLTGYTKIVLNFGTHPGLLRLCRVADYPKSLIDYPQNNLTGIAVKFEKNYFLW